MPEKVFRISPMLCVVGEDGKVKCSAGSATEAIGMTRRSVNSEIASAKAATSETVEAAEAAEEAVATGAAAEGAAAEGAAAEGAANVSSVNAKRVSSVNAKRVEGTAESAAIVVSGKEPLSVVENTGFAKLYASLPSSSKVKLESYFEIINDSQRQRLFEALNRLEEDKKKQALVTFAALTDEKRNNVIQQLTDKPSANLLEIVSLKGGRKTLTSHKRRKASKKTRKAQ